MCAIDRGAQAIVVCCGSRGAAHHRGTCAGKGRAVLATPTIPHAAARLISTAAPVRHFYAHEGIKLKFSVNTPIEDAKRLWASVRHRYFPILMRTASTAASSAAVTR